MKVSIIALIALASATAASAADKPTDAATETAAGAASDPAADAAVEAPKKEKLVCHTDKMTGTRTKVRRICRTKAQWDEIYEFTRSGMNNFTRASNQTAPAISDGQSGWGVAPPPGGPPSGGAP